MNKTVNLSQLSILLPKRNPTFRSPRFQFQLPCPSSAAQRCSSVAPSPPSMATSRWLRPEVYPLFAAVGAAVGLCCFQLVRNLCINPEVRVSKAGRSEGVLDNFSEGEKYAEHKLRKFLRGKTPEVMPNLNRYFSDPAK